MSDIDKFMEIIKSLEERIKTLEDICEKEIQLHNKYASSFEELVKNIYIK